MAKGVGVCPGRARRTVLRCCAAFFCLVMSFVMGSPPIPYDRDGHIILRKGSRDSSLKVEVYLDLACSDCAMAWPVMLEVAEEYGQQAEFLFRLFPLPYHRTAFVAAQAAQTVRSYSYAEDSSVEHYFTIVFDGQGDISNRATADMSEGEIESILASWAVGAGVISMDDFSTGMDDPELNMQTRYQFKYGCLHGVSGTPFVYIGGVLADGLDGSATAAAWRKFLDPLVNGFFPGRKASQADLRPDLK